MDNKVKIISNNVRGLQSQMKRRKIFHHFNTLPDAAIILLQETHSTPKIEKQWRSEWGGQVYFNHGSNDSKGVCILIKNNVDFEIQKVTRDTEGRFIQVCGMLQNKSVSISNVYGPNRDDVKFFTDIQEKLETDESDYSIIGGDFNCILNNEIDKKGGTAQHANKKNQGFIKTWMEEKHLVDIWRQMHPYLRRFTYHQQRPQPVFTRLDFFLISQGMTGFIDASNILPGYCTDHSMITITLKLLNHPRGRGFWKLNSSLLNDPEYIGKIKETITETCNANQEVNDQIKWELVKYKIRQESIKYASFKKRQSENNMISLQDTLQKLEDERDEIGIDQAGTETIENIREQIDKIQEEKTKGAMIRCRIRWHEQGEKSTKYFLNLEKRNHINKTITRLRRENHEIITEPNQIQGEMKSYYQKLYSSHCQKHQRDTEEFLSKIHKRLTDEESNQLEMPITEQEIFEALKTTANGKSPGSDGINCEFYKVFWIDIKHLITRSINAAFVNGEMSTSQKHGVITLLPKHGKDTIDLKNWRPISLLNQDYKLAAKCIATRIKHHLKNLINSDQTGFIKGRYIGENINRILSIMEYTEREDIPAIISCIDFEKAFDSLEHHFIINVLRKFNFGTTIIQWVKTLYTNPVSCVLNNGWTTPAFKLERGVRQGCPLSPYLFILAAEALACNIRSDGEIKGISINEFENKICQFADDTCLFLKFDTASLDKAFKTFENFRRISGLKVNYEKTELFPIGTIRESKLPLYNNRNIKWSPTGVRILGIHITHNKTELLNKNYKPILTKIENIIKIWKQRDLTLYGKVAIIKAHLQSQLIYQLSVLPSPHTGIIQKIQRIIFKYLWNEKPDKIKRSVIHNTKIQGGLGMPHLEHQHTALKITWVHRLLKNLESGWAISALNSFPKGNINILKGNISANDLIKNNLLPRNQFWREVVLQWAKYNYKELDKITDEEMNNQPLWFNSHVKIRDQVIFYTKWNETGINKICDLKDEHGNILNFPQFRRDFHHIETTFLTYYGLLSAIPNSWRANKRVMIDENSTLMQVCKMEKPSKGIYTNLTKELYEKPEKSLRKWKEELQLEEETDNIILRFKHLYSATTATKTREFQFRLLHRCLGINSKLFEWGIKDSSICDLCGKERETYIHLFCTCEKVTNLWQEIRQWAQQNTGQELDLSPSEIILGNNKPVVNLITTLTKRHIYACKMKKTIPRTEDLIKRIAETRDIERKIAMKDGTLKQYIKKWGCQ